MSRPAFLTPARRDAALAAVALALVVAPVWVPMLHVGDPTYRYERTRVTADDGIIAYANESPHTTAPISVEVACTADFLQSRGCFFEQYLAADRTVPTSIAAGTPNGTVEFPTFERYSYVVVNDSVYATRYVANRSEQTYDGRHRVDLALEPADARDALRDVSVTADDVPAPVREAAASGVGTAHRDIDVPKTPVRLDGGRYYRVYPAGRTDPLELEQFLAGLLRWGGFLVGVGLVVRLSGRFTVRYEGPDE